MPKKKFALNNSYFKIRHPEMPGKPIEILEYYQEHLELPFKYSGHNWVYDMFCEYQKRKGVDFEQFLTPDETAKKMVNILTINLGKQPQDCEIFEIGCGTGQIMKYLDNFHSVLAIDIDDVMLKFCQSVVINRFHKIGYQKLDFRGMFNGEFDGVICNPPYSGIPEVLNCIHRNLKDEGIAVVLLPKGTFQKERPKALMQEISKFEIQGQWDMDEKFERTNIISEITLLKKI